jgi:sterol desaturase/sphingolipid hydroxylase (fatty acid hydroxylase superfamily)
MSYGDLVEWFLRWARGHVTFPIARGHLMVAGILLATIFLEVVARRDWKVRYGGRGFRVDVLYYVFYYGGFYHLFVFKPLYALMTGAVTRYAPGLQLNLVSGLSPAWQLVSLILVSEIVGYWGHRWLHTNDVLWRFHSIHHSQTKLNVMTNYRFHFVDETFRRVLMFVPALIFGYHVDVWLGADLIMAWLLLLQHSEWDWDYGRLGWVFVSPVFHRRHHSTDAVLNHRNYGMLFTFWDDLFGTAERLCPAPTQYGLVGERVPESFFAQQLWPFRRLFGREPQPLERTSPEVTPPGLEHAPR